MKQINEIKRMQQLAGLITENTINEVDGELFRVFESDDFGRAIVYMGVFKANSDEEALEKASKYYNNKEISSTGFYNAEKVTNEELTKEKNDMLQKIEDKTTIISV